MILKGEFVRISKIILEPGERAEGIPLETKNTPLKMWVKGYLMHDANIGEQVTITTVTNRSESGILEEVNPVFQVNYGNFVPEILQIDQQINLFMNGVDSVEL